jgi:hypothetical protein
LYSYKYLAQTVILETTQVFILGSFGDPKDEQLCRCLDSLEAALWKKNARESASLKVFASRVQFDPSGV